MIKSKKTPSKDCNIKDYPKLMEYIKGGSIYFMSNEHYGFCVFESSTSISKLGDGCFFANTQFLRDYNEEITLQNV